MTTAAGLEANGFHSNFAPPQALFLNSTKNTFITFFLRHLAISVLIGAAAHQNLPAQPANEPLEKFVAVDGQVTAIAKTNNVLYFGGQFDVVGVRTGSGVPVSITTGQAESTFPSVNGRVYVAIADGQGGWFVGGAFTLVGELVRTNLVHIRKDRTVDPNWSPNASGVSVQALVLSGNTLYIGGAFTNISGQPRNCLAAVDAISGSVNGWDPNAGGTVRAIVVNGTNAYVGGDFTTVGGQARLRLASVDASTGGVTPWTLDCDSYIEAMIVSGGHIYIGGAFANVSGQPRTTAASFNPSTGLLDPWNPNIVSGSPIVYALAADQNNIFIAGQFSQVGTSNRANIAAVDATTGLATSWDAAQVTTNGLTFVRSLSIYSNVVYVGGYIRNIGGQPRNFAAGLDINTATATPWDPKPSYHPLTFSGVSNSIYVGGLFGAVGCVSRTNLAAYDLVSNQVTTWNPAIGLIFAANSPVSALAIASNRVFLGGSFTNVNGVSRSNLVSFDLTNGTLDSWDPNPNTSIVALATQSNRLYVGGFFTNILGTPRTSFAEIDLTDGSLTFWDPGFNNSIVQSFAVDGNTLYVGGTFRTIGGITRRAVAAFDLTTDSLTSWNPGITSGNVQALAVYGGRVNAGGSFTTVAGLARSNYFAISTDGATLFPAADANSSVSSLAATSNLVFIAGNFTNIAGQGRYHIAALNTNSNTLTSWSPTTDIFLNRVIIIDNVFYPAGAFTTIAGESDSGMAAFPLSLAGYPSIVSNSMQHTSNGGFQFRLTALGVPQATVQTSSNMNDWQTFQTVPLISGNGSFTDTDASNHPIRFYRLSVP